MGLTFKPADLQSLAFLVLLSIITVCFFPADHPAVRLLTTYCFLAAAIAAFALYRNRAKSEKTGLFLYTALTVTVISIVFNSLGDLIAGIWSRRFDDVLIMIDYSLFGVHPTVWIERMISPAATAALQFAYISYYFIPVSVAFVLISKNRYDEFEQALFGIVLCFYLSYIGYLLMPAVGPRFTLDHLQTVSLQAGPFIKSIQEGLDRLEHNKTDAFPSGHTAVALMSLYYSWKFKEKILFRLMLPMVAALMVSTVYLRYHYVIDVIAGIALTAVAVFLAPFVHAGLSRTARHPRKQRHGGA